MGMIIQQPLQEFLNHCFATEHKQTELLEFLQTLADGETTDEELVTMNEMMDECRRRNAKFIDGPYAEVALVMFTTYVNNFEGLLPDLTFDAIFVLS